MNMKTSSTILLGIIMSITLSVWGCGSKEKELEDKIASLEIRVSWLESDVSYSYLETDGKSYGLVKTRFGAFPVTFTGNVTPYLDGYKVTLGVGNPTNITFNGAKITIKWGNQTKEFNETGLFYPGRYTYNDLFLTPAKPDEIKMVHVALDFNILSLR